MKKPLVAAVLAAIAMLVSNLTATAGPVFTDAGKAEFALISDGSMVTIRFDDATVDNQNGISIPNLSTTLGDLVLTITGGSGNEFTFGGGSSKEIFAGVGSAFFRYTLPTAVGVGPHILSFPGVPGNLTLVSDTTSGPFGDYSPFFASGAVHNLTLTATAISGSSLVDVVRNGGIATGTAAFSQLSGQRPPEIPEPSTIVMLLGVGLPLGCGYFLRRQMFAPRHS